MENWLNNPKHNPWAPVAWIEQSITRTELYMAAPNGRRFRVTKPVNGQPTAQEVDSRNHPIGRPVIGTGGQRFNRSDWQVLADALNYKINTGT